MDKRTFKDQEELMFKGHHKKFHVTSMCMRTGNHQPSWPTIPQILSVLSTVFTCVSSRFFLPFFCARFFVASFSTSP
ncbi:hypothetical protein E2C01_057403 [Portunus trituberculatus]|uniref:Uncharacterized protein n=1 Tax=Portunus trituberculatus TaxID=210409 RepID=A0A5B7H0E0_PORTR|nr:hypothetical protein [Portunus trituberculatus]